MLTPEVVLGNPGSNSLLYALTRGSSPWCALSQCLAPLCSSQRDKAAREGPCPRLSHGPCCYPAMLHPDRRLTGCRRESRMDTGSSVLLMDCEALFIVDQKNTLWDSHIDLLCS